jgi:hypothetical protein
MFLFRVVFGLLGLASLLCLAMFVATKEAAWKQRGIIILKWTVIAAAGFFGVLILERIALVV